jgi:anaerobic selenocysteine-containing dehydrogenase
MPPGVGGQRFPLWTQRYREMQSNALADQIDSDQPYPIKAMFAAGINLQFFPNTNRMIDMLKKLDFMATTDYFPTPATRLADIVLPIASWLERQILLNKGSSIELIQPAIEPVGESWHEWKIYAALAKRLGFGELFWDGDCEKCVNHIVEPAGITYRDLQQSPGGIKPPSPVNPDTPAAEKRFQTPSGKVEIASSLLAEYGYEPLPVYKEPPESPLTQPELAKTYPLVMTSGARVPAYFHSQFRNIPRLRRQMPEPLIDIHPSDAKPRAIQSGDPVIITSPRGSIRMKAKVTSTILKGVVSLPHHWPGDANANILVDDQTLDPISGFPPFKSQLCQVEKV